MLRALGAVALLLVLVGAGAPGAPSNAGTPARTTRFRLAAPPVALAVIGKAVWVVVETQADACTALAARCSDRKTVALGGDRPGRARHRRGFGDRVPGLGGRRQSHRQRRPGAARPVSRIRVPGTITSIAAGLGSVWAVAIGPRHVIVKLDPGRLVVRARIPTLGGTVAAVAAGSVWVAGGGSLARLNPRDDRLTDVTATAGGAVTLARTPARIWLLSGNTAFALDRAGRVRRRLSLPFAAASMAVSNGRLWAIDNCGCATGQVTALDLRTGRQIADWAVGATPVAVAAGRDRVWVASFGNSTLTSIPAG